MIDLTTFDQGLEAEQVAKQKPPSQFAGRVGSGLKA